MEKKNNNRVISFERIIFHYQREYIYIIKPKYYCCLTSRFRVKSLLSLEQITVLALCVPIIGFKSFLEIGIINSIIFLVFVCSYFFIDLRTLSSKSSKLMVRNRLPIPMLKAKSFFSMSSL